MSRNRKALLEVSTLSPKLWYVAANASYRLVVLLGGYWVALNFDADQYNHYSQLFWLAGLMSVITSWGSSNWFIEELSRDELASQKFLVSAIVSVLMCIPLVLVLRVMGVVDKAYYWVLAYAVVSVAIQNSAYLSLYQGDHIRAARTVAILIATAAIAYSYITLSDLDPTYIFGLQFGLLLPAFFVLLSNSHRASLQLDFAQVLSAIRTGFVYVPVSVITAGLLVTFQVQINQKLGAEEVRVINLGLPLIGVLGFLISNLIAVNVRDLIGSRHELKQRVRRLGLKLSIVMVVVTLVGNSVDAESLVVVTLAVSFCIAGIANGASYIFPLLSVQDEVRRLVIFSAVSASIVSLATMILVADQTSLVLTMSAFFVLRLVIFGYVGARKSA